MEYKIEPCAKPRMTRQDRLPWKQRPIVRKYWAFKNECALNHVKLPTQGADVTFVVPVFTSWSKKKKAEMIGKPHQQTPDLDNYIKGLFDAVYADDSCIWEITARKIWGEEGKLIIRGTHG